MATGLKSYTVLQCMDYLHAFCLSSFVMFIFVMFCFSLAVLPQALFWVAILGEKDSHTSSYFLGAKYEVIVN